MQHPGWCTLRCYTLCVPTQHSLLPQYTCAVVPPPASEGVPCGCLACASAAQRSTSKCVWLQGALPPPWQQPQGLVSHPIPDSNTSSPRSSSDQLNAAEESVSDPQPAS